MSRNHGSSNDAALNGTSGQGRTTALLVDEHEQLRELLAAFLCASGVEIVATGFGDHVLQLFRDTRPDVLVVDLGEDGERGVELVRAIRRLPAIHGGRALAVALSASTHPAPLLSAGFDAHLSKPVHPHTLLQRIAELVRERRRTKAD